MQPYLWVGLGGAFGALARFGVVQCLPVREDDGFPWATFGVNFVGCLLIGVLLGLEEGRPWLGERARLLWISGFLGSFTTFSTFGHETLWLMQRGHNMMASIYVVTSLALAFAALLLGSWLGSLTHQS